MCKRRTCTIPFNFWMCLLVVFYGGLASISSAAPIPQPGSLQVPLKFSPPDGSLSGYTASHPVTFGVPFPRGTLKPTDRLRIVDDNNVVQPAAFDKETAWEATSDTDTTSVKWVHIDLLVPVVNGTITPLYLQYGPTVPAPPPPSLPLKVTKLAGGGYSIDTKVRTFTITALSNSMGSFSLEKSLRGENIRHTPIVKSIEHENKDLDQLGFLDPANYIRATIKVTGFYRGPQGQVGSDFITRYRFYAGSATVNIQHTLIRTENDGSKIASLAFTPNTVLSSSVSYGLNGHSAFTTNPFAIAQIDSDRLHNGIHVGDGQLDGWIQQENASNKVFVSLRWPWQQYPTKISGQKIGLSLKPILHMIGPVSPLGLEVEDHVIPPLASFIDETDLNIRQWNIPERKAPFLKEETEHRINPVGVAKTYELVYWYGTTSDPTYNLAPNTRNLLVQHPIYATTDPAFVVQAGLPSPNAPQSNSYPTIEDALDATFTWMTRQRKDEYDFGIWNFGDIRHKWLPPQPYDNIGVHTSIAAPPYRYWMNQGKGWSVIPWMLWMRSGDRKYLEHAEANARHVMDVDTSHVDDPPLGKFKGVAYSYDPIHFGQSSYPSGIQNDSEYLSYTYHLLGYERARDVILEREHALLTSYAPYPQGDTERTRAWLNGTNVPGIANLPIELRCIRDAYRNFGELAILYEETHNPKLKEYAVGQPGAPKSYLDAFKNCAYSNGFMPGIKTQQWFSHSFLIAARAFPDRGKDILDLLEGWEHHIGMREKPSDTGQMAGPTSLWTLWALENRPNNSIYGSAIAGYATATALSVNSEVADNDDARRWRGISQIPGDEAPNMMRDLMVALARLTSPTLPAIPASPAGMTYMRGQLPSERPYSEVVGRSVIYVREDVDQEFHVLLDFHAANAGYGGPLRIRVYPPNATSDSAPILEQNTVLELPRVAPLETDTLEALARYQKTRRITIPPDGLTGAYGIEILSHGQPYTLGVGALARVSPTSPPMPLVHYIPTHEERLSFFKTDPQRFCQKGELAQIPDSDFVPPADFACSKVLWAMGASLGAFDSPAHAGAVWFSPPVNTDVEAVFADGADMGPGGLSLSEYNIGLKLSIYHADNHRCSAQITGTKMPDHTPAATHCTFSTGTSSGLHSMILANDGYPATYTKGTGSFFASSSTEWFDVNQVAHPPKERFLAPEFK